MEVNEKIISENRSMVMDASKKTIRGKMNLVEGLIGLATMMGKNDEVERLRAEWLKLAKELPSIANLG